MFWRRRKPVEVRLADDQLVRIIMGFLVGRELGQGVRISFEDAYEQARHIAHFKPLAQRNAEREATLARLGGQVAPPAAAPEPDHDRPIRHLSELQVELAKKVEPRGQ